MGIGFEQRARSMSRMGQTRSDAAADAAPPTTIASPPSRAAYPNIGERHRVDSG